MLLAGEERFMSPFIRPVARWLLVPAAVSVMGAGGPAQTGAQPLVFSAQLVNLSTQLNLPNQTPLDITINRWSTAGEREQLVTVLRERGRDGLLEMMQNVPRIGTIRIPGTLNYDFHFALRTADAGGNQAITLITDRPVSFAEAVDGPRTLEYRFMVIQLEVNSIGRGQGRLSIATKVEVDRITGEINLETWENLYVTLRDVRRASGR
jgi:hypothetical protein